MGWLPDWADHAVRAVPLLNIPYAASNGDWGEAGADALTGGFYGTANQGSELVTGKSIPGWIGEAKDAYTAPFNEKRQAIDQVSQMAGNIKQERIKRQQDILAQTLAARDPERQAIAAMYGDPKSWKL